MKGNNLINEYFRKNSEIKLENLNIGQKIFKRKNTNRKKGIKYGNEN